MEQLKKEHFKDMGSEHIDGLMTTEDEFDDLGTKYSLQDFLGSRQSPKQTPHESRFPDHELLSTKTRPLNVSATKRPVSGIARSTLSKLERIYGNQEQAVPMDPDFVEEEDSPRESVASMRTGFSRRSGGRPSRRLKGIQRIYAQKPVGVKSRRRTKARFRTMIGQYVDNPAVLARNDSEERLRQEAELVGI